MDEIETRLKEAADNCIKSYEGWVKDPKNSSTREGLQESVHELRKVAARLEIEIAVSERNEMASKPLPIPPHRSSQKRGPQDDFGPDDNIGNSDSHNGNGGNGGGGKPRVQRRRRVVTKGGE
ncbi:MAG: hypothetical protein H6868_05510 [Rhodospirillales bacterium]|nr:hypothetical protein [Rhodospirillales bacterium]